MLTLKTTAKAQRRQREKGAVLQLNHIERHIAEVAQFGESPAATVARIVQEREGLAVGILRAWIAAIAQQLESDMQAALDAKEPVADTIDTIARRSMAYNVVLSHMNELFNITTD